MFRPQTVDQKASSSLLDIPLEHTHVLMKSIQRTNTTLGTKQGHGLHIPITYCSGTWTSQGTNCHSGGCVFKHVFILHDITDLIL